jgi:hypothetical protein
VTKRILFGASALLVLFGCATVKKPAAPPATTATPVPQANPASQPGSSSQPVSVPPSKSPAPAPAGPLRPEVPPAEEQRLLESTRQNIADVARTVGELEGRTLKPTQQDSLRTAKNLLDDARTALDQKDYQRAANLASKARALTDDLAGTAK